MTKEQSQMMKGVAILLMIFLHLFDIPANVVLCRSYIYIDGEPLVFVLSRASGPVAFFLILGGYGLYKVSEKKDRNRWYRVFKLFIHYWITLVAFVSIGHLIAPETYPGSFSNIIANITAFHTTYNAEMWFLFPYVVLSLIASWLFKLMKPFKAWMIISVTFCIHLCTSYCISRYGLLWLYSNHWIYNPLLVFHMLFPFSLGSVAARDHFFEKIKIRAKHWPYIHTLRWIGIVALVIINCVFKYNFFYAFLIITLLVMAPLPKSVGIILSKLGNQSMNMWMIHTWFCYYLFHNFIYSFLYPILIFIILTSISYVCSLIVNAIAKPIELRLMTKAEVKEKPIL